MTIVLVQILIYKLFLKCWYKLS